MNIYHTEPLDIDGLLAGTGASYDYVETEPAENPPLPLVTHVLLAGDTKRGRATYDQWGVFLANVYEADDTVFVPDYGTEDDFYRKTFERFDCIGMPTDAHGEHTWVRLDVHTQGCSECSAKRIFTLKQEQRVRTRKAALERHDA